MPPPVVFTSTNIQTVGGITYLTFSARVVDGEIAWSEVLRDGTNLLLGIGRAPYICLIEPWLCPSVTNTQTSTVVLGNLPAGNYGLRVFQVDRVPSHPVLLATFSVPQPSSSALTATRTANGIHLQVNGVPLAEYTLESSTNLFDWTRVYRSPVATFSFSAPASLPQQFFRVAVTNGTVLNP